MTFSLATDREALKLQDFLFLLGFLLGFVYKISRHQKLLSLLSCMHVIRKMQYPINPTVSYVMHISTASKLLT